MRKLLIFAIAMSIAVGCTPAVDCHIEQAILPKLTENIDRFVWVKEELTLMNDSTKVLILYYKQEGEETLNLMAVNITNCKVKSITKWKQVPAE